MRKKTPECSRACHVQRSHHIKLSITRAWHSRANMEAMLVGNFMEKRGVFQLRAWSMISRKRGVFSMERDLNCLWPTSMASIFAPARHARVYYTQLEDLAGPPDVAQGFFFSLGDNVWRTPRVFMSNLFEIVIIALDWAILFRRVLFAQTEDKQCNDRCMIWHYTECRKYRMCCSSMVHAGVTCKTRGLTVEGAERWNHNRPIIHHQNNLLR